MKKYYRGDQIKSLDELVKQEFIFFQGKVYHAGWFKSWPLRVCYGYIDRGVLFRAENICKPKQASDHTETHKEIPVSNK